MRRTMGCAGAPDGHTISRVSNSKRDAAALAEQVDAAMTASRVFVAVIGQSMEEIDSVVSPLQLRTLVIVAARGPLNVTSLADLLGVHASNATRVCDRLVRGGLLARTQSDLDRRHLELTLTTNGQKLVKGVMDRRRAVLTQILSKMSSTQRSQFTDALQAFGEAAGEGVGVETGTSQYDIILAVP